MKYFFALKLIKINLKELPAPNHQEILAFLMENLNYIYSVVYFFIYLLLVSLILLIYKNILKKYVNFINLLELNKIIILVWIVFLFLQLLFVFPFDLFWNYLYLNCLDFYIQLDCDDFISNLHFSSGSGDDYPSCTCGCNHYIPGNCDCCTHHHTDGRDTGLDLDQDTSCCECGTQGAEAKCKHCECTFHEDCLQNILPDNHYHGINEPRPEVSENSETPSDSDFEEGYDPRPAHQNEERENTENSSSNENSSNENSSDEEN